MIVATSVTSLFCLLALVRGIPARRENLTALVLMSLAINLATRLMLDSSGLTHYAAGGFLAVVFILGLYFVGYMPSR